VPAAA